MRNKLFGLAAIAVVLAGVAGILSTNGTEAAGGDRVVAGVGMVPGQGLIVHVMVVVPPGQSDRAAVDAALAAQGARPITSAEYSLTGLVHDGAADAEYTQGQDEVVVVYHGGNMPSGIGSMGALVSASMDPWTAVTPSALVFENAGALGGACPSLLKECPGAQVLNGANEVAFWALKGRNTLAVTWSHSGTDEFDIVWNTKFTWVDDGTDSTSGEFDAITVGIHEFGHGAGIGHSTADGNPVMEAVYEGGRRLLTGDDKLALSVLYGGVTPPEATPTPEPGEVTELSVSTDKSTYINREPVLITVDAGGVEGVSVTVRVSTPSGRTLSGSSTTGADGTATLNYKVNAGRDGTGTYYVVATGGGLTTADDPATTFEVE